MQKNHFYYAPLIENFKESMKDPKFLSDILYYKSHKTSEGQISDIYDGWTFKRMKKKYFPKDLPNEIVLLIMLNTDGFSVSKKASMWPFFCSLLNVAPEKRRNTDFTFLTAFAKKTRSDIVFQATIFVIVEELLQLMNGFDITVKDETTSQDISYHVKGYLICAVVDMPARAKLLLQKDHGGKCSCCFCDEEGETFGNKVC